MQQHGFKASHQDGILENQAPKAEEAKPKQIAISML
jgi:HSP20 family molecular chaperone IbpA